MAEAYKLKADASLPSVVRTVKNAEGVEIQETAGANYAAGSYVLASDLTPRHRERAENGDLDHLLEAVSLTEAQEGLALVSDYGTFIPEHEAERVIMKEYGHQVVERDQVLELKAAGSDAAKSAIEASRQDGADERPALTEAKSFVEVPSIQQSQEDGAAVLPKDAEQVPEEALEGVEQPPGLPVGSTLAAAEGEDVEAKSAAKRKAARSRPGGNPSAKDEGKKDE